LLSVQREALHLIMATLMTSSAATAQAPPTPATPPAQTGSPAPARNATGGAPTQSMPQQRMIAAPRPSTCERSRSATSWRDPTACSARPQELTRKFTQQPLRRAICRSFLHPAAPTGIRRSGRNKSALRRPHDEAPGLQIEQRTAFGILKSPKELRDGRASILRRAGGWTEGQHGRALDDKIPVACEPGLTIEAGAKVPKYVSRATN
jgi:hypothetical protein